MKLMGVDVGFSKTGETSGIACLDGEKLYLSRAGTRWESRKARIPDGFRANVIAIDGPLLPRDAAKLVRRRCEFVFIRAPFSSRCKPGLSHWGFGLELRRAAADACAQFSQMLDVSISSNGQIVEAFPNAFLAVLLPHEVFLSAPRMRRGHRFDWLYERVVGDEILLSALSKSLNLSALVWHRLRAEADHELRAALVCLLTAAFAAAGSASRVGDAEGGWFWLPPWSLWQEWAREGLRAAEKCVPR